MAILPLPSGLYYDTDTGKTASTREALSGGNTFSTAPVSTQSQTSTPAYIPPPSPAPTTTSSSSNVKPPAKALDPDQLGGSYNSDVEQLQRYLVQEGYMTQAEMNTGAGFYGPKTKAAVTKLQDANGVNYGSYAGYYGPQTISKLGIDTRTVGEYAAIVNPHGDPPPNPDMLLSDLTDANNYVIPPNPMDTIDTPDNANNVGGLTQDVLNERLEAGGNLDAGGALTVNTTGDVTPDRSDLSGEAKTSLEEAFGLGLPSATGPGMTGGSGTGNVGSGSGSGGGANESPYQFDPTQYDQSPLGDRPDEPKGNLVEFSTVLSKIVDASRQKREMFQNKFIPGQIPLGSMSANSFTGIMNKMSSSSSQFSRDLAGSGFKAATADAAQDQRNFELELAEFNSKKESIQKVALGLMEAGAPSMVTSSIAKAGTLDAALAMASDWTSKHGDKVSFFNTGQGLVQVTKNTDGTVETEIVSGTAPTKTGSGGGGVTSIGGIGAAKYTGAGQVFEFGDGTKTNPFTQDGLKYIAANYTFSYESLLQVLAQLNKTYKFGYTDGQIRSFIEGAGYTEESDAYGDVSLMEPEIKKIVEEAHSKHSSLWEFGNEDEYNNAIYDIMGQARNEKWNKQTIDDVTSRLKALFKQ